jgi:spermidine/putrescine-binding protein
MSSITRRTLLAGAAAGLLSLRLGDASAATTMRMLSWPAYDNADATEGFRKEHDVRIQANYIGANDEIFTFLRAGGLGKYDVVTPGNGLVQPLARAGLIQPLDLARIPNAAALFPPFQSPDWASVDGQVYGLPLSWRTNPMIYNADALPAPPELWTDLADVRFKGKVVMMDDAVGHFTVWNRAMGAADPARVTKTQLSDTAKLLTTIKRDLGLAYVGSFNDVATRLATGGGWATTIGQEIIPWLPEAKSANLRLARPTPGDFSICDCLCIPAQAPNIGLAYAYLDHMLSGEAQAALANKLYRASVSSSALDLLRSEVRGLFQYEALDEAFAVSPLVGFPPLEAEDSGTATYVDWVLAWDRIRFTPLQAFDPPTPTPEVSPSPELTPTMGAYFE